MTPLSPRDTRQYSSPDGYLLVLSDLHLGGCVSTSPGIMPVVERALSRARHVVFNGDMYELFYRYKEKGLSGRKTLEKGRDDALADLRRLLAEKPDRYIHFVLGNHEKIDGFREGLQALQQEFPNFEWHPESIRIGKALFTHGDLQIPDMPFHKGKNDHEQEAASIKKSASHRNKAGIYAWLEKPGSAVVKRLRRPYAAAGLVFEELKKRAAAGSRLEAGEKVKDKKLFHYLQGRESHLLTEENWAGIEQVFFGHTHVQFPNADYPEVELGGKRFYNTGGTTRGFDRGESELGFIAAELAASGLRDIISYRDYLKPRSGHQQHIRQGVTWATRMAEGLYPEEGRKAQSR